MNKEKLKGRERKMRNSRGITLIALIITIVVLLILAVVAIRAVTGDRILEYAINARDDYQASAEEENTTLQGYLDKIEANVPGGNGGSGDEEDSIKGKIVTEENLTYTETVDGKTLTAIIPVGFCVVKDIEGDENSISRGLVISDVAEDDLANSKSGNQFVWIPVEDYSKFRLIGGYHEGSRQSLGNYKEAGESDTAGEPITNNVAGTTESKAMYQSVEDNKGFYIARFEAGISAKNADNEPIDNYTVYNTSTSNPKTATVATGAVKPLSKKGVGVWNYISWGGASSDTASDGLQGDDTADGAVKVARSMYTKSTTCGVTSTLCYGVQWDAVMNYIDPNYYYGGTSSDSFVRDSEGFGNYEYYQGSALTGSSLAYEKNHIYDLAGNVAEWTMEAYDTNHRVTRGLDWDYGDGYRDPASCRVYYNGPEVMGQLERFPCSFVFIKPQLFKKV